MNVNSERAYAYIRKRILNGEYAPGFALMTEHLSAEIGVSRTPVRDALQDLRSEGLVTIQPRLGARVKKMDEKEYYELCDLRLALEVHAAGLAARRRTETDLAGMQFALESLREVNARSLASPEINPFLGELIEADVRFHIAIITAAHNDLIKNEILRIHLLHRVVSTRPILDVDRSLEVTKEQAIADNRTSMTSHEEIYAAILRQDAPGAKAAMEWHIHDGIQKILGQRARTLLGITARALTPEELAYVS